MSDRLKIVRDGEGKPSTLSCGGRPLYDRLSEPLLVAVVEGNHKDAGASPIRIDAVEESADRVVLAAEFTLSHELERGPIRTGFRCSCFPSPTLGITRAHLPKSIYELRYHPALGELGDEADPSVDVWVGCPGQSAESLRAHYLEPIASGDSRTTRHPLLLPIVAWHQPDVEPTLALFTEPDRPWEIAYTGGRRGAPTWSCMTKLGPASQGRTTLRCWLMACTGGHAAVYDAFHRYAHRDPIPPPGWLAETKVHYFDFLSPRVEGGPRGEGFEQSIEHFATFAVGLATTHGYYPHWGDYLHPDRTEWTAMKGDPAGSVRMSLEKLCARRDATRRAGSRFGVYLHLAGFDRASSLWPGLSHAVRHVEPGRTMHFPWDGPDMEGQAAFMSIASDDWADHLLRQAQWVMELLAPDAIVVDETFAGIGYDHHPDHRGPCSTRMIRFMQRLREIIKAFGDDKALLTSDCGMAAFSLWADGEGGDHAYGGLLGQPSYRREIGGFASVLHGKPWLPCAWQANVLWEEQMDLARHRGAGVGIGHGWIEYSGLVGLAPRRRQRMLADIQSIRLPPPAGAMRRAAAGE